ncbi:MAG: hypothetical protein HFE49_00055 [Clostridia bacterium]|nr:hypothetical protein [Clostridia bacterium]
MDNFVMADIVAILEPLDGGGRVLVNGNENFEIKLGCKDGEPYVDFIEKKTV